MYCGINKVPKGKKRGTAKECAKANQIRYYGIEQIDPDLLKKKKKKLDFEEEKLKLLTLNQKGKKIVNEYKKQKIILDNPNGKAAAIKAANKKIESLLKQRDTLLKKMKAQKKIVNQLSEENKEAKAKAKKKVKKTSSRKKTV